MDPLTQLRSVDWTPINMLKALGVVAAILVLFSVVLSVLGVSSSDRISIAPQMAEYDYAYSESSGGGVSVGYATAPGYDGAMLSARNIAPVPYGGSVGDEAEQYEVTQYSVSIETGNSGRDCAAIRDLKSKSYVVFENANEYDRGCSFTFKVQKDNVEEIVTFLEAFKPEDMSENVYSIVSQIKDFTSEEEILTKKLETITTTLETATEAYDDITALAIRTQNAESLAKIIESKLQIVERLTQSRIDVSAQLDRLVRAKAEQLDRLEYTYFHVNVTEVAIVDGDRLSEMWRSAASGTVNDINRILTEMTLGLFALFFLLVQWALYGLILLVIAKFAWKYIVKFWHA